MAILNHLNFTVCFQLVVTSENPPHFQGICQNIIEDKKIELSKIALDLSEEN